MADGTPGRHRAESARRAVADERRPDPRDPPRLGRQGHRAARSARCCDRHVKAAELRRATSTTSTTTAGRSRGPRAPRRTTRCGSWRTNLRTACRSRRRCSTALRRTRSARRSTWPSRATIRRPELGFRPSKTQVTLYRRPHRRDAFDRAGHRRLHARAEAAPPGRRQDARAFDRPVQPGHPAAAGRQGPVRRPALRRDGGLGARGLRRGVHAAGDADGQVGRRERPDQGLREPGQGRARDRRRHAGVVQRAGQGDPLARDRHRPGEYGASDCLRGGDQRRRIAAAAGALSEGCCRPQATQRA